MTATGSRRDVIGPEPDAPRRSVAARASAAALGCVAFAVLVALGTWQVQRLAWKSDLIARVEARIHAAPVPAPGPDAWPHLTADADAYRRVTAEGIFLDDRETLVQAVTALGGGFWVLTPLVRPDGVTVLVNRGFVPPERRDPAVRVGARIAGPTTVTGLLRMSEPGGAFLRNNDAPANRWYSRDVAAIAAARGLRDVAPYFIDAEAGPDPAAEPVGGLTVVAFPNNHLIYALTWYTLAGALLAAAVWVRREARQPSAGAPG